MSDKHKKRIKQYLTDLNEERDDLFMNVEKLIKNINVRADTTLASSSSLSENEELLTNLTKMLVLFSELNHSVLKCLETDPPVSVLPSSKPPAQELQDYFKEASQDVTSFDFTQTGPKVSNDQVQNEWYVRKPLIDTTLKAICSTYINSTTHSVENPINTELREISQKEIKPEITTRLSPSLTQCSESDIFSTISSHTYQHPLSKFPVPTEIPTQYDTQDLDKVRETMKFISRKMGFDSEGLAEMTNHFDKKSSANCMHEPHAKITPEQNGVTVKTEILESNQHETSNVDQISSAKPDSTNFSSLLNNQIPNVPANSTGAVKKIPSPKEDLIEYSSAESGSYNKVSNWLTQNTEVEESDVSDSCSEVKESAIDKLGKVKRYDRHEEAREKARADMPDLKLIPVKVPQVIRNDLNSDSGSSGKRATRKRNKKQDLNKVVGVYEITRVLPKVGETCVFSHIVSPDEFHLQIVNDTNSKYLDQVSDSLEEQFSKTDSNFNSKKEAFESLGKFCYGYIWENRKAWFRLEVLDWKLGCTSEEVEVQSVDYGFKSITKYSYLRELTLDLAHIPMLAVKCHFPLLFPPGSTYANRLAEWPTGITENLYDIANLNDDLNSPRDITIFEIIFADLDGDSVGVDLVPYLEPDADSLGTSLINMGLAVEITDEYDEHPELGAFLEDVNELERTENISEFLLGYNAQDEARICKFTRKNGTCYKGKNCKLEHAQLKGYTTDKTAVFHTAINDLILPMKGDIVQVLPTAYIDSCNYLVQLIRNPTSKDSSDLIMDKNMLDLMDAMNHPKRSTKYEHFKILPAVGEVVLGFHQKFKKWLRVAVRGLNIIDENKTIEVYSVDFGDEFLINVKDIRIMQEDFMHLPFQAVPIYLDKYRHNNKCDAKQAEKFFQKHMAYKTFLAEIKSIEPPFKVNLTTFKNREIGHTLIKEGFAETKTMDLHRTENPDQRTGYGPE